MPVAGDGTILRGLPVEGGLPTCEVRARSATERLRDARRSRAAAVAGAAPAALRARIEERRARARATACVAELRDGPELIFGDATRLRAKWAAAARVLADLEARGASYMDVRIPAGPPRAAWLRRRCRRSRRPDPDACRDAGGRRRHAPKARDGGPNAVRRIRRHPETPRRSHGTARPEPPAAPPHPPQRAPGAADRRSVKPQVQLELEAKLDC